MRRLLLVVALSLLASAATSQQPSAAELAVANCASISANEPKLAAISQLCGFALSYRSTLPNFICEQTTTSEAMWYGGPAELRTDEEVTFRDGQVFYSNFRQMGGVQPSSPWAPRLTTHGEFGAELINLFTPPSLAHFRFEKRTTIHGGKVAVFSFIVPQGSTSWSINDGSRTITPEFHGTIWIDDLSGQPLRLEDQANHLPTIFRIDTAKKVTTYEFVSLGEAGRHLLPTNSTSHVCSRGADATAKCFDNSIVFHDCRKFGAKSRIIKGPQ